jgi:hypothetical protein
VIVGVLLVAAAAFNLLKLPYPTWFKIANLLLIPAAIVYGFWVATRALRPRVPGP